MALSLHKDLLAGRYGAVAEKLLDRPGAKKSLPEGDIASLIGALSFLGRMDEAEALLARLESKRPSSAALVVAHFFLGIGWTRKSEYARARAFFRRNDREAGPSALERFFVEQGKVFYTYYTGRVRAASIHASRARRHALRSGDLFTRSLATDAYGHCRVVAGEIHHGMRLLQEARGLAERLGNKSLANSIAVSLELYAAEFGISGKEAVAKLESRWESVGTEDNYSLANVGLELARQYTRQGLFGEAGRILEAVAPKIYAHQNRRQEINLNLRLAELAYRRGENFSARHNLRFVQRLLHGEADSNFELATLGIERKLALAEGRIDQVTELDQRWKKLAKEMANTRDDHLSIRLGVRRSDRENQEDRVHQVLQASRAANSLPAKLRPLLENRFLCAAAEVLRLTPGRPALVGLPHSLGLLVQTNREITWIPSPLSSLQAKILTLLSHGDGDKAKLVESVWGYRYDPLRHDPMVYSAMSSLRKSLGAGGEWLQATEQGYRLLIPLQWASEEEAKKEVQSAEAPARAARLLVDPKLLPILNHRQIEILDWLVEHRFLAVSECRNRFAVSEITALRDLDGLRRHGLVVRNGKARATRYTLPETGVSHEN